MPDSTEHVLSNDDDPPKTTPVTDGVGPAGSPPPADGSRIGSYVIVRELGRGGMGIVYEATDLHLHRPVALKVMTPAVAESAHSRERFLREARVMAALDHPHIVPVFAAGEDAGRVFLAMPLLVGQSLDARLAGSTPMPVTEAVEIGRQIAVALAAAHKKALVHRDVKPSNVWLEADDDGSFKQVRLLDFGLSRPMTEVSELTAFGAVVGTPQYMAPEQARGRPVDHRADLFSLGATLFRMVTGQNPFDGPTTAAVLIAVATDPVPRATTLNPAVPSLLSDLINQLLAKSPSERPESAAVVAKGLAALTNLPVSPPPPPAYFSPPTVPPISTIDLEPVTEPPPPPPALPVPTPPKSQPIRRPGFVVRHLLPAATVPRGLLRKTITAVQHLSVAWMPPGSFLMGSPYSEPRRDANERPHRVTLSRPFFLGVHPVTVGQFRSFIQATGYETLAEVHGDGARWVSGEWRSGRNTSWQSPGFNQSDQHPVVCVAWKDAAEFCQWLGTVIDRPVRLPTEAEWEYACRAGTTSPFWFGHDIDDGRANYDATAVYGGGPVGEFRQKTTPVDHFLPNAWGLHDMHGNVWEWCADEYGPYPAEAVTDPIARYLDESRVLRGGSWAHGPSNCRSAKRISEQANDYIKADKRTKAEKDAAKRSQGSDRCSCVGFRVAYTDE